MTKEELKKDFYKYLKDSSDYYDPREPLTERKLLQMWLDCAEPREKRIAELKQENKDQADCNSRLLSQAAAATKRLVALEKENNKLLDVINNQDVKIADLEKENAELKEKINILENCDRLGDTITEAYKEQLAQAKEIIKGLLDLPDLIEDRTSEHTELIGRAEQFLKEIEKCNM